VRAPVAKRIVLALAAPVLFVAAAEAVLRAVDYGYPTSFLVPDTINGRDVWRDNPYFGYRFFPKRMARAPQPIVLDRAKPESVRRIFVLGESAAMGEPQALFGPARYIEVLLNQGAGGPTCEVVNAAMTAINSHAITEIARDVGRASPDILVIYMGNNEVVGPYGPGTVLAPSSGLTRLRVLAGRLRLAQLFRRDSGGSRWAGMEMFTGKEVAANDPRMDDVYAQFRGNLERIVAEGEAAGARVVLCTVAVNLRDCAPFAGVDARAAYERGDIEKARDLDRLRFRADSRINDVIRDIAAAHEAVTLVDIEALFGATGEELFIDHVHFTREGHYRLASAVAAAVQASLALAPPEARDLSACLDAMLYTPWNALDVTDAMLARRSRPPFSGQPGNAQLRRRLLAQRDELRRVIEGVDVQALRASFEAAMSAAPGDWRLCSQWGEILWNCDDYAGADDVLQRQQALLPHRVEITGARALVLGYANRTGEGIDLVDALPPEAATMATEHLLQAVRTLTRDGRPEAAAVYAATLAEMAPDDPDVLFEQARLEAIVRGPVAGEGMLRAIVERWPDHGPARSELAAALALQRRWTEADEVLAVDAQDAETKLKRIQLRLAAGEMASVDGLLRDLEASGEEPGQVALTRGLWHMVRREPVPAANAFARSAAVEPTPQAYFELARAYLAGGRTNDARQSIGVAIQMDPANRRYREFLDGM
jgi:tetratricopeptide (TPR) repeat protein